MLSSFWYLSLMAGVKVYNPKLIFPILAGGMALSLSAGQHVFGQEHKSSSHARFLWIEVPYSIVNPGATIGGGANCYGGSTTSAYGSGTASVQPFGNGLSVNGSGNAYGSTSGSAQCVNTPSFQIPSSTTNKVLSVHIDCKEKTYDAKGDGKAWMSWGNEQAVYERAMVACRDKEQGASREDMAAKWEAVKVALDNRKAEEQLLLLSKKYDLDACISLSLLNIKNLSPFLLLRPSMIGLSSQEQVIRFISLRKGSLEDNCREELVLIKNGTSRQRIELFWEKKLSENIQQVG